MEVGTERQAHQPLPVLLCSLSSSHVDSFNELLCFEFALVKNDLSLLEL